MTDKVWFITGASTGLGRELAEAALEAGNRIVATARRPEIFAGLAARYGNTILSVKLDVTRPDEAAAARDAAVRKFGRVDVLVNNAGFGMIGAVEETSDDELRRIFDTNFFGPMSVTRAFLPLLREQGNGHILNVSSIGGFTALFPGFGAYCATKFALEAESEALSVELAPFGVRVTIVEPGSFRTEFSGAANARPRTTLDVYQQSVGAMAAWSESNTGKQPGDPRKAAEAMLRVVDSSEPPLRLLLGGDALTAARRKLDVVNRDFADWESVSEATDFPGVTTGTIGG